jgi:hypothetical protein
VLFLPKRNRPKQGVSRAELAQAIADDYATVEGFASNLSFSANKKGTFVYQKFLFLSMPFVRC